MNLKKVKHNWRIKSNSVSGYGPSLVVHGTGIMGLVEDLEAVLMEGMVAESPNDDALVGVKGGVALPLDHALGAHFLQLATAN